MTTIVNEAVRAPTPPSPLPIPLLVLKVSLGRVRCSRLHEAQPFIGHWVSIDLLFISSTGVKSKIRSCTHCYLRSVAGMPSPPLFVLSCPRFHHTRPEFFASHHGCLSPVMRIGDINAEVSQSRTGILPSDSALTHGRLQLKAWL